MKNKNIVPRKVQILTQHKKWKDTRMTDLIPGDIFRLFEPDGEPVLLKGEAEMYVRSKATLNNKTGHWNIKANTLREREWFEEELVKYKRNLVKERMKDRKKVKEESQ